MDFRCGLSIIRGSRHQLPPEDSAQQAVIQDMATFTVVSNLAGSTLLMVETVQSEGPTSPF